MGFTYGVSNLIIIAHEEREIVDGVLNLGRSIRGLSGQDIIHNFVLINLDEFFINSNWGNSDAIVASKGFDGRNIPLRDVNFCFYNKKYQWKNN